MRRRYRGIAVVFMLCLILTACRSDGITSETKDAVTKKTNEVLALYSDVEKVVNENSIEVAQDFKDMKQQLIVMSDNVKSKLEETTEQDGKRALEELEKIKNNLEEAKNNVEKHIAKEKAP